MTSRDFRKNHNIGLLQCTAAHLFFSEQKQSVPKPDELIFSAWEQEFSTTLGPNEKQGNFGGQAYTRFIVFALTNPNTGDTYLNCGEVWKFTTLSVDKLRNTDFNSL